MKTLTCRTTKICKLLLVVFFILISERLTAASLEENNFDLIKGGLESLSTSDEFNLRSIYAEYMNHRRESHWPYQESDAVSLDWGVATLASKGKSYDQYFQGTRALGTLGKIVSSSVYLIGQLGAHKLKLDGSNESDTIPIYLIGANIRPIEEFQFQIEANKDFLYQDAVHPGGVTDFLTANNYIASFQWRPFTKLRIANAYKYSQYSDDNIRRQDIFSILYGISESWPWIWLGVGGEYLAYDKDVVDYYSPSSFKSTGLRFDSSFPITEKLSASVAANADIVYEEDLERGRGRYIALGVQYNFFKDYYLLLDASVNDSYQRASEWREKKYGLTLAGPLF